MAKDPNLASDNSLFMEANTGDGGTHTGAVLWLSPDVTLPGDKATAGVSNPISLRVHKNANPAPPGTGDVLIEVWVGIPSLLMAPNVNTVLIGTQAVPLASLAGGVATATQNFTPTGAAGAPDAAGHRCLVARCFSDLMSPDAGSFYLHEDPHYVQHNITVIETPPAPKKFSISSGNDNRLEHELMTIQVFEDLRPSRFVQAAAINALTKVKTFERFAATPSKGFALDLARFDKQIAASQKTGLPIKDILKRDVNLKTVLKPGISTKMLTPGLALKDVLKPGITIKSVVNPSVPTAIIAGTKIEKAEVTLNLKKNASTGLFGKLKNPNVAAQIAIPPKMFNTIEFTADVSKSRPGTAHIYHFTQVGANRKVRGGLTVVVAVK